MRPAKLTELKGVGPAVARQFALLHINTLYDLLHYFPRKHEDYSTLTAIRAIKPGLVTIKATIKQAKGRYVRRGMHVTEAVASDATGSVRLVWFNQPYRETALKPDKEYFITGKLELKSQRFALQNPSVELVSAMPVHTARIVPIYRESRGVKSGLIRKVMAQAVQGVDELPAILPKWVIKEFALLSYGQAVKELHFPSSAKKLDDAKRSLGFVEVFELMLAAAMNKRAIAAETSPAISFNAQTAQDFVATLPFRLTDAQRKTMWQVCKDMDSTVPMNRLVEGDVGSGKTVVAAMAAVMTLAAGYQVALLAPTELLARQHADSIMSLLKPLHLDGHVGLLVGSLKTAQKQRAQEAIGSGNTKFIIGTHALLQDKVVPKHLGLLIIDEQHRFGVEQRKALLKTNGNMPHVLSMTATPIPRSLALTLYGELAISLLDAMPPGRKPIMTSIVSPNSRDAMYVQIENEITKGHQVYMVCPVITEATQITTLSAEALYKNLQKTVIKNRRIGLLHGKLKAQEKTMVMEAFVRGNVDILVATTVIEVGVNVPNATVMVIEGADRFGLAQMHQLRGRVGRSVEQGYCFVVPSDSKAPSKRLRALAQSTDGFRLAELDLELRGPGAIYGTLQSGELDLRFANLSDTKLLVQARQAVRRFLDKPEHLATYPELKKRVRLAQAVITLN
jgi:ATP-dependent DNA helicase RecG